MGRYAKQEWRFNSRDTITHKALWDDYIDSRGAL